MLFTLDFSKAFDKVDHSIVLTKFKNLGITGKIYNWIESFLKDRQQTVGGKLRKIKTTRGHFRCSTGKCTGTPHFLDPHWRYR